MTPVEAAQLIQVALQHHRAGRLVEAEAIYRQVLAGLPDYADALHLLGVLYGQTRRAAAGVELVARACAIAPNVAILFASLGSLFRDAGRPDQAVVALSRAIQLQPGSAETYNNLGNALIDLNRNAEAAKAYQAALQLDPRMDRTWSNLAIVLHRAGKLTEAITALNKAIELAPDSSIAYDNLGIILREDGQIDASLAAYERALALKPDSSVAWGNFSVTLKAKGRLEESVAACHKALALDPNNADASCNLGVALAEMGRTDEAIAAYRHAVQSRPGFAGAWSNFGISLGEKGLFAEAMTACQKAVDLDPGNPSAHFNLGIALLQQGQFERGWIEYEWRWRCHGLYPPKPFTQPRWQGQPLDGKTIFLHADQGLGDTIQFIRYVRMVRERGGRVILGCDAPLRNLLDRFPGVEAIYTDGEIVPPMDVHLPVVSLPAVFATAQTVPGGVPYLHARPYLAESWREKLAVFAGQLKVGLVWAGRPSHGNDRNRSLPLARLAPLAGEGIKLFSLQKGAAAVQVADAPAEMQLTDFSDELLDLVDTAGFIANLDLLISVDTSVAHLAGAMGRPVWTLLPRNADWRWMLDREDTPWYPTMRLFRQRTTGDWEEVIARVAGALRQLHSRPPQ